MIEINDQNYNSAVSKGNVIVVFSGKNCGYCRMLENLIHQIEGKYRNVVFAKYSTDTNTVMKNQFKIMGIPQTYFYKNGQIINRVSGYNQSFENIIVQYYGK